MRLPLDALLFRSPTLDDAQITFDLIIRCDISEYGEPDSDIEDLFHEWEQIDLNRNGWLAFTLEGDLVGYAAVLPWGNDLRYMFYVDPRLQDIDLGQNLLELCETRSPAIAVERGLNGEVVARTFIPHVNQRDRKTVEEAGFLPGRYYFQMQIDVDRLLEEPVWPDGISIRTFHVGQDEAAIFRLIESAFFQPGRPPTNYEDWVAHMMRPDIFESDFWFLAHTGEKIVGACLCVNYSTGGWVRQLGVYKDWRRMGIGAALLRHAFIEFQRRGVESVGLSVESKRPDAFHFYQSVGMRQVRQYDEYLKPIN